VIEIVINPKNKKQKMKNPKKFTFTFKDVKFTLAGKYYRTTDYYGKDITPSINVNQVAAASLVKQYVKTKYPEVVVSARSDSYSGGCSTRVYLSDKYGNEIDETIYKDVRDFGNSFQYGTFNGMIDMYESSDKTHETENGTLIDPSVKFVFVNNGPGFDTVPEICKSILETMKGGKYRGQEERPHSLEEALEILSDFHTNERRIRNAVELVKEVI
jgi:hypothetical protein